MVDRARVSALFARHSAMVYRRAVAILGDPDDAKDATQDVFVRAFLERESFEGRSEVATWLYRITTNVCLNRIRDTERRTRLLQLHHRHGLAPEASVPEHVIAIRRVLEASEEQAARAAIYVYIDGMSHREASEMLGVAKRTVGNLLERFQRFATAALEEQPAPTKPEEEPDAT